MESAVAEVQGLYGPFAFHERLLQKLWLRGEFDGTHACTVDGRSLEVLYPGRWNQLGGPDFKGARVRIGGSVVIGDVEIHLRAKDWRTHDHESDRAYDGVILHVVLFPTEECYTPGGGGRKIPVFSLLPHLCRGLEEFAADDAVERMANRSASRALDLFLEWDIDHRWRELRRQARNRWKQKIRFAGMRIRKLGWEEACHQTALEVLGYRYNRAAMLRVAAAFPLPSWEVNPMRTAEEAFASERENWMNQGVRPANLPRLRLAQYARWVQKVSCWPQRLLTHACPRPETEASSESVAGAATTPEFRRRNGLLDFREGLAERCCGDELSGARFDTFVCDAAMPLLHAQSALLGAEDIWYHWFPGDLPPHLAKTLQALGLVTRREPLCHGLAQGLLGWWIDHEKEGSTGIASDACAT